MAKFLQETLRESGIKGGKSIVGTEEFKAFFYKVRIAFVAEQRMLIYCLFVYVGSIIWRVTLH